MKMNTLKLLLYQLIKVFVQHHQNKEVLHEHNINKPVHITIGHVCTLGPLRRTNTQHREIAGWVPARGTVKNAGKA